MSIDPRCPLCGKPTDPLHRPFCSRGCRDRDLLNWMGEGYKVSRPVEEGEEDDGAAPSSGARDED